MPTDEDAARAMLTHGVEEEVLIGNRWLESSEAERRQIALNHFSTFDMYRKLVHYQGVAQEASNLNRKPQTAVT